MLQPMTTGGQSFHLIQQDLKPQMKNCIIIIILEFEFLQEVSMHCVVLKNKFNHLKELDL